MQVYPRHRMFQSVHHILYDHFFTLMEYILGMYGLRQVD